MANEHDDALIFYRERCSNDALPASAAAAVERAGVLQPGGQTFQKPSCSYPNDGCYGKSKEAGDATKEQKVSGLPVSGRPWKLECKRASSIITKNSLTRKKCAWEAKEREKMRRQTIKAKENALKQARIDEKREQRERQKQRALQKEANILKGAVVQAISTKTVKKMSRKQLRDVRKMDVHDAVINPAPIKKTKGLNGKVVIT